MPSYDVSPLPFKQFVVSGIELDVFGLDELPCSGPIAVAFHLHGRLNKKKSMHSAVSVIYDRLSKNRNSERLPLVLVCFDHRNHGTRLVDNLRNFGWRENEFGWNSSHGMH